MQWGIRVPQRMPWLKHRRAHDNPYYNMSFYKKSRLLSNTSVFDYHILDPNSKSISFSPTYLYHNQPCQKYVFLLKKKIHHWKKKRHTQNTHFPLIKNARPWEPKPPCYWEALLPYNSWRRKMCRAMKCLWRKRSFGRRETSWFRRFCFLAFLLGWESGSPMVSGKCWVGWEIDSRCRVKLGKRGIHEQNHGVFLNGNMQWQTTHRFWCCWCQRLLKGSPAVAAIWVMVYGSLPTKNWSNVVTLAVMVAESCLVYGVEFMGKTDQAAWWRGLCGWFTKKLQKYDN